jgi:hypothetical protein
LSLFSAFLDEISAASVVIILSSSSVRDGHDDDVVNRSWQDDVPGLSMARIGENRLFRWIEFDAMSASF